MRLGTKIILILFILAIGAVGLFFVFNKKEKVEYTTAFAEIGDLHQTVSEVGTVKAVHEIELSFPVGGKLNNLGAKIGDTVEKDSVLAELDYSSLLIKKQESQASLDIASANLSKILRGATPHEIAVSKASVDQAKQAHVSAQEEYQKARDLVNEAINQAKQDLFDLESSLSTNVTTYEQAVTTAEINLNNTKNTYSQAIRNKEDIAVTTVEDKISVAKTALDQINTILTDSDAQNYLSVKNNNYLVNTKSTYGEAMELVDSAEDKMALAESTWDDVDIYASIEKCQELLDKVFESLNYCYGMLEASTISTSFTQTELDTYKANTNAKITALSTAISSVQTARQNLDDAVLNYSTYVSSAEDSLANAQVSLDNAIKSSRNSLATSEVSGEQTIAIAKSRVDSTLEAWDLAVARLSELESPARSEDLALYRAQVKQAEANLDLIKKQIEDSKILAPISGKIIDIAYDIGEQVMANSVVIKILGDNNFEIEVDISEADISKIRVGNEAEITFDAFTDEALASGRVYFIEPAETIIQDVIYYRVKIRFDASAFSNTLVDLGIEDTDIRSGMTANVVITTESKDGVVIVPNRAIIEKNGSGKFARILVKKELKEVPVQVGLRGDGGMVEILSGVEEGDEVITHVKK